jgi:hypothetical protein
MNTTELAPTLALLFGELVDGPQPNAAYILNTGDPGLLRSLERISAAQASRSAHDGASVAAHVEHLRYGLSLANGWAAGEDPYADADWSRSWQIALPSESEWTALRAALADEAHRWVATVAAPRDVAERELNMMVSHLAHIGYHLGAIRQIVRETRGPRDGE